MSEQQTPLNAFLARKAEIDNALVRLQALSNNHFNTPPAEVDWGTVVDLGYYAEQLKKITDCAFKEGEFAESGEQHD